MLTTMKTKKYILFALAVLGLTTSCMKGDWDTPSIESGMTSYGNQDIKPTNLMTIAQLKQQFAAEISGDSLKQVTKPMQIQGVVTGNDVGGNIYNSLYLQDNTGAIVISIGQGGLYGPLGVGQSILIELNGLYVGGYGKQPQIGTIYTDPKKADPKPQVGRMTRLMWNDHYKLIDPIPGLEVKPLEVKLSLVPLNIEEYCGRLITLKGVELKDADGTAVFAPTDGSVELTANCANRPVKNFSNMLLRTSSYADFANAVMPTGRVDITGVASRYNDAWQIMMRTIDDIKAADPSTGLPPVTEPQGSGTKTDPYNVVGAFNAVKDLKSGKNTEKDIYIKGIIVKIDKSSFSDYGNINYYISDDPDGLSSCFYIYRGLGLNKAKFKSADDIQIGDEVVVAGIITNFRGTIEYQSDPGSGIQSWLVSNNKPVTPSFFEASFESGKGDFTIDDKDIGSLTSVWNADNKGYMKASAFVSNTNNAAESWLVSPEFSLKDATAPVMTFNNACNYVKTGTITDHIKVMVYDGANWTEATIVNLPDGASWTFVDSTVDLKNYAGKEKVKIAFKYVSTTAVAPTWEIKTVSIK